MKKLFKRLMKRLYVKAMLWYRNSFYKNVKSSEDNEKICTAICRKLINHPDSKFLIAPLSEKRYIKNEKLGIFILLNGLRLNITNHIYNYDIDICEGLFDKLSSIFDEKVEKIRLEFEIEMQGQIQHSLSKILDKVTNESSL